jgi:hypothetical protein
MSQPRGLTLQLSRPVLGSLEHDYLDLLAAESSDTCPASVSPQTGVIDAGVELFATMFPLQNQEGQVQSLATLSSHNRSGKLERNPGRKQAVIANTVTALRRSLANAEVVGARAKRGFASSQVTELIRPLLQVSCAKSLYSDRRMPCWTRRHALGRPLRPPWAR